MTPAQPALTFLDSVPPLPQAIVQLLDACHDPEVDIGLIGKIVAGDPVISGRVLHLANSAFLGARIPFTDINQAVIFLGTDTVRNLALSVSIHEAFSKKLQNSGLSLPEFWYHSLLTALIAKSLAEILHYPNTAEAYLCGLLHDLGKLVLVAHQPDTATLFSAAPSSEEQLVHEKQRLETDHAAISACLMRRWSLPEHLATAVANHHQQVDEQLTTIIFWANRLSHGLLDDIAFSSSSKLSSPEARRLLLDESVAKVDEVAASMGLEVGPPEGSSASPPQETEPSTPPIQEKTKRMLLLHGALDNLVNARNPERVYQVVEETLTLLFDLHQALFLIPDKENKRLTAVCSSRNPLFARCRDLILPAVETLPFLHQCLEQQRIAAIEVSSLAREHQRILSEVLDNQQLLAVPLPLENKEYGVLLIGLGDEEGPVQKEFATTIRLLANHAGARLQIDRLSERLRIESVKRELHGVEKIARSIAHEISNPLGVIQNYLTMLERKISDYNGASNDLQLITKEIGRISAIARQLEKINDPSSSPVATTIRFDALLRDTVTLFRESLFARCGITLQVRIAPETRGLEVPREPIHQILAILLTNGAEAMIDGGTIEVEASLIPRQEEYLPNTLQVRISDNGPGVPPELQDSLFNVGVSTKNGSHLGLGLSIARKKVTELGGHLNFSPSATGGASFTLLLPC